MDNTATTTAPVAKPVRKPSVKFAVKCMECGKRWMTAKSYVDECPRCGGADIDVA